MLNLLSQGRETPTLLFSRNGNFGYDARCHAATTLKFIDIERNEPQQRGGNLIKQL